MEASKRAYEYDVARIAGLVAGYVKGGPLERDFYVSPEVFNADLDRIWRRHWLFAGLACQVPKAGDWITWSIGDDAVVVVRGRDGNVRAFHNTCRHRGARICNDDHGHSKLLVCPYHAWSYELDGRLRTATEQAFGVKRETLGLHPVQLKNLGGLLFVALGPDPVSFEAAEAEIMAEMPHQGLDDAKVAISVRYRVAANWKLIFENNRECYHCANAHPEYIKGTYDIRRFNETQNAEVERQTALAAGRFQSLGLGAAVASSAMTGGYWRVSRSPLMEGWSTETLDGTPAAPLMGIFQKRNAWSKGTLRTTVFPNFWQHANDDHAVPTRITPIDSRTTEVEIFWLVHKDAVEGRDYTLEKLMPFWQRTSEQDWKICEANQKGVASPAYRPGPYATKMEANVQHFIDWYIGALAMPTAGKAKPKLRSVGYKDRPGG